MDNNHCNKHGLKRLMQYHEKTRNILRHCLVASPVIIYLQERFNLGVRRLILSAPDHVLVGLYIYWNVSLNLWLKKIVTVLSIKLGIEVVQISMPVDKNIAVSGKQASQ